MRDETGHLRRCKTDSSTRPGLASFLSSRQKRRDALEFGARKDRIAGAGGDRRHQHLKGRLGFPVERNGDAFIEYEAKEDMLTGSLQVSVS